MRLRAVLGTLALPSLLVLAGCFSSLPDKKYYQIPIDAAPPAAVPFAASLLVERCEIDSLYDDFRIVYRVSPYEINYYSYKFWAEKPSKLIRDSLIRYLEAARLFPKLHFDSTKDAVDWTLRTTIRRVEEIDGEPAWAARLDMKIEVVETKSGARLAVRSFDRREPLPRKDVGEMPAVLARILSEELGALFAELRRK
jgi:cholesterol transport system auxiliary component